MFISCTIHFSPDVMKLLSLHLNVSLHLTRLRSFPRVHPALLWGCISNKQRLGRRVLSGITDCKPHRNAVMRTSWLPSMWQQAFWWFSCLSHPTPVNNPNKLKDGNISLLCHCFPSLAWIEIDLPGKELKQQRETELTKGYVANSQAGNSGRISTLEPWARSLSPQPFAL